jgi:hypothetical protein
MKKYLNLIILLFASSIIHAQSNQQQCGRRTFYSYTSFNQASIGQQLYANNILDSMYIYWGDGQVFKQYGSATGSYSHSYPQQSAKYLVTMELWGADVLQTSDTFHCVYSDTVEIRNYATTDSCFISWREEWNGNTLSISNTSHIFSSTYAQYKDSLGTAQTLWDFGNGQQGFFANRIHDVTYTPGTYLICHRVGGFSFANGGYIYNCNSCKQISIAPDYIDHQESLISSIFPSPNNGVFVYRTSKPIAKSSLHIYDLFGRPIAFNAQQLNEREWQINMEQASAGTYIIKGFNNGSSFSNRTVLIK